MRTWTPPPIPKLPGHGLPPRLMNTATGRLEYPATPDGVATLYVCGITPYDATHIGHAFTFLTYDLLQRVWHDAGVRVNSVQNVTDVDDPLLERAKEQQMSWRDLADDQIRLYRSDMHRMRMLPPTDFTLVTEVIEEIANAVRTLLHKGLAYEIDTPEHPKTGDIYFDVTAAEQQTEWRLGDVAPYDMTEMEYLSEQRGGDPERPGKRHPLDPLLWRAHRPGEPGWEAPIGYGRPGWHIECAIIATGALGPTVCVQGGGHDLIFPHHEFTAASATALTNQPLAYVYSHTASVAYHGHKMSKSRGNLVFVSELLDRGVSPSALRLALLSHHYRSDFEWQDGFEEAAEAKLRTWARSLTPSHESVGSGAPQSAAQVLAQIRAAMANDLDTPVVVAAIDAACATGVDQPALLVDAIDALLGIDLRQVDSTAH